MSRVSVILPVCDTAVSGVSAILSVYVTAVSTLFAILFVCDTAVSGVSAILSVCDTAVSGVSAILSVCVTAVSIQSTVQKCTGPPKLPSAAGAGAVSRTCCACTDHSLAVRNTFWSDWRKSSNTG